MRPASRTDNYHVFVLFVRGEAAMPTNSNQNISAGAGTIPYKAPYPTRPHTLQGPRNVSYWQSINTSKFFYILIGVF